MNEDQIKRFKRISGTNTMDNIDLIYDLHIELFGDAPESKTCGSCMSDAYYKIKDLYNEQTNIKEE
jgi:hypothetical protein